MKAYAMTALLLSYLRGLPVRALGVSHELSTQAAASSAFGQVILAYYSGEGQDTMGAGGVNAVGLAFFDAPSMTQPNCDFTNPYTPCVTAASGAGQQNLQWALQFINASVAPLSGNTAPNVGGKPIVFFSFGGQAAGGVGWDNVFATATSAAQFGTNAAHLAGNVSRLFGGALYVGIDLDIEETGTTLPFFGAFIKAFRALAPFDSVPLQMCALSGLSDPANSDYFKIALLQQYGPAASGLNFLNMMVVSQDMSCGNMSAYWLAPALDFLPPSSKIFGIWGELVPAWILHNPGCTDGANPLFPLMQQDGIGIGIWEWWDTANNTQITDLIAQIRQP